MNNKTANIIMLAIVVVAFVVGTFYYPRLPERVISHWNASGEANGHMDKFWGVFLLPIVMLIIFAVYALIPLIDPLKENIKTFRKYYNAFWILFEAFFIYIYGLIIVWNMGGIFDFNMAFAPAIAVLFFCTGSLLKNIKRNWFMGVRTPWTLSSDYVWDKTHKLAGKLFQISAVIILIGVFLKGIAIIFVIVVPVLLSVVIAVLYSYLVYKKINKK